MTSATAGRPTIRRPSRSMLFSLNAWRQPACRPTGRQHRGGLPSYLAFLAAYSVQLSSKQVHDHFNADGLDVASEVAAFRAYGDENMLRHGAAISVVAEAIAASRTVISDIITSGRSMT